LQKIIWNGQCKKLDKHHSWKPTFRFKYNINQLTFRTYWFFLNLRTNICSTFEKINYNVLQICKNDMVENTLEGYKNKCNKIVAMKKKTWMMNFKIIVEKIISMQQINHEINFNNKYYKIENWKYSLTCLIKGQCNDFSLLWKDQEIQLLE
jgi:hypothetical protein